MLSQLEMEQAELSEKKNFLDIHLYITTFSGTKDMKAVTLKLALDLMHQKVVQYTTLKKYNESNFQENHFKICQNLCA